MSITIKIANFVGKKGDDVGYLRLTMEGSTMNIGMTPAQARAIAKQAAELTEAANEADRLAGKLPAVPEPAPKNEPAPKTEDAPHVGLDIAAITAQITEQVAAAFAAKQQGSLAEAVASRPKRRAKGAKA